MRSAGPTVPGWWQEQAYLRGLELLNQGQYFAAHESLEEVWRTMAGRERQFVQGLIQVAVALHHHRAGNAEGAIALMDRAMRNLSPYADVFGEVDLAALRMALGCWLEFFSHGGVEPAPIVVLHCGRTQPS